MTDRPISLNDRLWSLERDLAKALKDGDDWALSWRLLLRKALTETDRDGYDRGHHEGMKDAREARHLEEEHPAMTGDHACPLDCCESAIKAARAGGDVTIPPP